MALGSILRKARESRKLTTSQVASATHMKSQTVDAIEREDFSRMPAAIYCKGFIKLYAEYMGMDPDPLTREYVERFVEPPPPPEPEKPAEPPVLAAESERKTEQPPPVAEKAEEEKDSHPDLFDYGAKRSEAPPEKLFEALPPKTETIKETGESSSPGEAFSAVASRIAGKLADLRAKFSRQEGDEEPVEEPEAAPVPEPVSAVPEPAADISPIALPNRQIIIISGAVVGAILIVFLISVIARFISGDEKPVDLDTSEQSLVLPVDPPPPYID